MKFYAREFLSRFVRDRKRYRFLGFTFRRWAVGVIWRGAASTETQPAARP
jgi:hypothetical protein